MELAWISRRLEESRTLKQRLAGEQGPNISHAGHAIATAFSRDAKLLLFGNGGSAADAQHLAAEFVGRFARDRAPFPALALTTDTSVLTAVGNDYGFEQIFARQIVAWGRPGDIAVAISTSGRSPNVLAGVEAARGRGLTTIGLTGSHGGLLASSVDIPIIVPSRNTARVQECHITIGHILCEMAETLLFAGQLTEDVCEQPCQMPEPEKAPPTPKIVDWEMLLSLRARWRAQAKVVVWTNGCFDLLHVGHVRSLQAARSLGDVLIVGVNSDASVRRLKGPGRPIITALERVELLAALGCVDYVLLFDELTPEVALSHLEPDVHCKGADYASPHGRMIPEATVVKAYGGRVEFLPLVPCHSTSDLVRSIRAQTNGRHDGEV